MIDHWFEPQALEMLIYDLANYFIFFLIFYYLLKKNYIGEKLFIISSILLLTPFLFNGIMFDWTYLPDQSKYLSLSYRIRQDFSNPINFFLCDPTKIYGLENCEQNDIKVFFSSFFYAFSPIVNFETYKSIGFYNRFLFIISVIFFYKKKAIDINLFYLLLLSPSLILFSSVGLRDNLILLVMLFWVYYMYENKYFKVIFLSIIILAIKIQNFLIFGISAFLIFVNSKKKLLKLLAISSSLLILLLIIFYFNEILWWVNKLRRGLFLEEFGHYKSISSLLFYEKIRLGLDLNSLRIISINLVNFIFSPLKDLDSLFKLVIFTENIFLYTILTYQFFKNYRLNKNETLIWFCVLVFSLLMYSVFVFNDAQIHRYKTPIIFFIIFAYNLNLKKKIIK